MTFPPRPRVEIYASVIENYRRMFRTKHNSEFLGSNEAILKAWDNSTGFGSSEESDAYVIEEMEWMFAN